MAYITENQFSNQADLPISLSATRLAMGNWLTIASVKILKPMRLTCRALNLQLSDASVDVAGISSSNLIYGNLGLVYVVLRQDFTSGSPGVAGGLDTLIATDLDTFIRDPSRPISVTAPGVYSWVIANNTQPSTAANPGVPTGTSIDFTVTVSGSARLELEYA